MSHYFIEKNGNQSGPYTLEELSHQKISRDTLVWKEGLINWIPAQHFEELKDIIYSTPPPLPNQIKNEYSDYIKEEIKKIWIDKFKYGLILSFFIAIGICILMTREALAPNAEEGVFPIYLSQKEKTAPLSVFLKFFPYVFVSISTIILVFKFLFKRELINKKTSSYLIYLIDFVDFEDLGKVKKFKIEFKTNHEGLIYCNATKL